MKKNILITLLAALLLSLIHIFKDSGLPREEFKLKVGAFGAEPWTESMRRDIEIKLGIKAVSYTHLSFLHLPGCFAGWRSAHLCQTVCRRAVCGSNCRCLGHLQMCIRDRTHTFGPWLGAEGSHFQLKLFTGKTGVFDGICQIEGV